MMAMDGFTRRQGRGTENTNEIGGRLTREGFAEEIGPKTEAEAKATEMQLSRTGRTEQDNPSQAKKQE